MSNKEIWMESVQDPKLIKKLLIHLFRYQIEEEHLEIEGEQIIYKGDVVGVWKLEPKTGEIAFLPLEKLKQTEMPDKEGTDKDENFSEKFKKRSDK